MYRIFLHTTIFIRLRICKHLPSLSSFPSLPLPPSPFIPPPPFLLHSLLLSSPALPPSSLLPSPSFFCTPAPPSPLSSFLSYHSLSLAIPLSSPPPSPSSLLLLSLPLVGPAVPPILSLSRERPRLSAQGRELAREAHPSMLMHGPDRGDPRDDAVTCVISLRFNRRRRESRSRRENHDVNHSTSSSCSPYAEM